MDIATWTDETCLDRYGLPLIEAQDAFVNALAATSLPATLTKAANGEPLSYVERQKLQLLASKLAFDEVEIVAKESDDPAPF